MSTPLHPTRRPDAPNVDPCADEKQKLDALLAQKQGLQNLIARAQSDEHEIELREQLKAVNQQIAAAQAAYRKCRDQNPVPTPMNATFSGTATVCNTFTDDCSTSAITITATFSEDRTTFYGITMDPIRGEQATATLKNPSTVKGTYDPGTGEMQIPVDVAVDIHSLVASDGSIHWDLTTGSSSGGPYQVSGKPVDAEGRCSLVDVSQFSGGTLGGSWGSVELEGTWTPHPSTLTTSGDGDGRRGFPLGSARK